MGTGAGSPAGSNQGTQGRLGFTSLALHLVPTSQERVPDKGNENAKRRLINSNFPSHFAPNRKISPHKRLYGTKSLRFAHQTRFFNGLHKRCCSHRDTSGQFLPVRVHKPQLRENPRILPIPPLRVFSRLFSGLSAKQKASAMPWSCSLPAPEKKKGLPSTASPFFLSDRLSFNQFGQTPSASDLARISREAYRASQACKLRSRSSTISVKSARHR